MSDIPKKTQIEPNDLFSLAWLAGVVGPELKIELFLFQLLKYVKKAVSCREVSVFLWDETVNKYYISASSSAKKAAFYPLISDHAFYRVSVLKLPQTTGKKILMPMSDQGRFVGALSFESHSGASGPGSDIARISLLAGIACSNIRRFAESERRVHDMFKFSVLSRALNTSVHEPEIVKVVTQGLEWIIRSDIYGFLILDKHVGRIYIKSRKALSKSLTARMKKSLVELSLNFIKEKLEPDKLDVRVETGAGKPYGERMRSSANAPLITKDRVIGLVCLLDPRDSRYTATDQQNLMSLAAHAAVAFENARLYDDLKRTYFSIVSTLTSAIEAKDPYTQGHSIFVSRYAVAIAKAMGLSYSMIESIEIAGLLHDLGKLGVPEDILLKKDKLTNAEYEVVKAHPEIALKILGPVEFPHFVEETGHEGERPEMTLSLFETADLSEEVKLMIFHHHEKFAGGGYPKGLQKEEIPLGARIMAVADTFEALTADRPYRKAFGVEEASKILWKISGEQLDPKIVKTFLKILKEKGLEYLRMPASI